MNNRREGLLSVHTSVLIFGLTALFSKIISLSAIEITLLRSIFAVLIIAIYIIYLNESLLLKRPRDYVIALILGAFLASHWVTYFHSMQVSSVAIGIISLYSYPVITVFLEPLFDGERPHTKDIISGMAVLVGIYLLVPEFNLDNQSTQGVLWGVLSAFLFAMRNIIHRRYFNMYPARHALMYQGLFVIVLLLPFSFEVMTQVSQEQWIMLIILGVFFTALPHTLFANSLLHLKAKTVGLIGSMQVVYGTVFALIFLAEMPTWSTLVGGVIVVAAAIYETLSTIKQNPSKTTKQTADS